MRELLQHALARGWARGDTAASLLAILYQAVQMSHTSWFERVRLRLAARGAAAACSTVRHAPALRMQCCCAGSLRCRHGLLRLPRHVRARSRHSHSRTCKRMWSPERRSCVHPCCVPPFCLQGVEGFAICLELLLIYLCLHLRRCSGRSAGTARQQRRRLLLRTLLAALLRVSAIIVVPRLVDLVHAMAPGLSPRSTNGINSSLLASCTRAAGARACAASVAAHLRGLVMLLLPVAWVHALLGAAIGWQLPPVEHLLLQTAATALLLRRAPAGAWPRLCVVCTAPPVGGRCKLAPHPALPTCLVRERFWLPLPDVSNPT